MAHRVGASQIELHKVGGGRSTYSEELLREKAWEELIRLRIRGVTVKKCAEVLGYHEKTVQGWMAKPEWKLQYMKTRAEVFQRTMDEDDGKAQQHVLDVEKLIDTYSEKAIDKIKTLMDTATKQELQLKAAIDLADRGPRTSKTKKIQGAHVHTLLTAEMLAQAAAVAKEIRLVGKPIAPVELDASMVGELEDLE